MRNARRRTHEDGEKKFTPYHDHPAEIIPVDISVLGPKTASNGQGAAIHLAKGDKL